MRVLKTSSASSEKETRFLLGIPTTKRLMTFPKGSLQGTVFKSVRSFLFFEMVKNETHLTNEEMGVRRGKEKVLHVIYSYFPSFTGGRETIIKELILKSKSHPRIRQLVVSLRRPNEPRQLAFEEIRTYRILGIPSVPAMSCVTVILNMLLLALKSLREACTKRVLIAHIHSPGIEAIAGLLLKKILKVKLIVHVHSYVEEELSYLSPLLKPLWSYLYRACLSKADVAIFVNSRIVQHTLEKSIHMKKPIVITPGVDLERFNPTGPSYPKHKLLQQAGVGDIPQNPIIVAHVGALRGGLIKGQDLSLKVASIVTESFPHVRFIFVGKGDQKELRRLANQLHVSDYIGILGERRDIPQILRSVDTFIHPSRFEGFGIAVLEAMACGKPVIATAVGGAKDMIENGVNGLLIHPSEVELAENLIKVIKNKKLRRSLSSNAVNKAKQYSWKHITKRILEIYEDLLKT